MAALQLGRRNGIAAVIRASSHRSGCVGLIAAADVDRAAATMNDRPTYASISTTTQSCCSVKWPSILRHLETRVLGVGWNEKHQLATYQNHDGCLHRQEARDSVIAIHW